MTVMAEDVLSNGPAPTHPTPPEAPPGAHSEGHPGAHQEGHQESQELPPKASPVEGPHETHAGALTEAPVAELDRSPAVESAAATPAPVAVAAREHHDEALPATDELTATPPAAEPVPEPEPLAPARAPEKKATKSEKVAAVAPTTSTSASAVAELEPPPVEAAPPSNKKWYVVKVQSGREETIRDAIERRVRKEGLEEYYGQIIIPVEKITEVKVDKAGKRSTKTKDRKLYPGYLMAEVEYNDRILYLFRETSGVGDFVGGMVNRPPPPMSNQEIAKIMGPQGGAAESLVPTPPKGLGVGDRVKVTDGAFNGMEGEVKKMLEAAGKIEVELTIFGRPVKLDLEYYQIELV